MKRRDLLDASKLLARHKMDRTDPTAMSLAATYLSEKRDGKTDLPFDEWLDCDVEDEDDEESDSDPT